jgi:hypothetical protein
MTYLNSVSFDKTAGLPLTGRLAHLSVPLGLVCSERNYYNPKRNFDMNEVICESDYDKLTGSIQHKNKTRSSRNLQTNVTKKKRKN